jgi:ribosomal protein L37AE/L43A
MGNTNINIDDELKQKAKESCINISKITEQAIRDKLRIKEIQIKESLKCEFCGNEGVQETALDVETETNTKDELSNPTKLVWLYPDEKWICNSCLRRRARRVMTAVS